MGHKHERQIPVVVAAILFALAVSVFIVLSHSFITFTGVQNVRSLDGMIYGVNINETRNELFAMDADTGEGQFLKIDQMGRDGIISFPALEISGDGTVYLVRERFQNGNVDSMELVRWNLDRNRLETVWILPDTKDKNLTGFAVEDDRWYFLYYAEDAMGKGSETAYALTKAGRYYKLESTEDVEWDLGVSGVSISSLPFARVQQKTGTIVMHIVLVMLAVLALEILLWIVRVWWKTGPRKHRSLIRMAFFTTIAFVILMTLLNGIMKTGVFNYISSHKIYGCEVEAEVLSKTLDQAFLDDLADVSEDIDASAIHYALGNHWNLFTGIAVYRGNDLMLEGDLFLHGRTEMAINVGSLKDLVDEALQSGERISTIYAARRGVNALVLQPVTTESGAEMVICVRAPMRETLYDAYMIRRHIIRIMYAILAGMLLIAVAQVLWDLAPLEKLRRAMDELAAGNLSARAPVRGHNELAYAATEFNLLADLLEEKQGRAERYRHFYEAFLPMNFLRNMTDDHFPPSFKAGSSAEAETVLLSLRIPAGASGESEGYKALLPSLVQIVEDNDGSVVEFRRDGLAAVFTGTVKDALFCALQLQRRTQEETGKSAFMGMNVGMTGAFVAGSENRREICVKRNAEVDILLELSELLHNALIVSGESAAFLHTEESGFHFRSLGRMGLGEYSSSGELYALMDAELPDVRSKRERNLPDFEKGVRAYASGDYFTARMQMVRCLLTDPDDRTARSYCLNCERKEPPAICKVVR